MVVFEKKNKKNKKTAFVKGLLQAQEGPVLSMFGCLVYDWQVRGNLVAFIELQVHLKMPHSVGSVQTKVHSFPSQGNG